jgi:4-amino-4-deoxy-L-arabinose transferase-like glycosyltransferase
MNDPQRLAGLHRLIQIVRSRPLVVILLAFAITGIMHNAATPLYEAPDEIWHDAYVRWLVRTGEFPPQDSDRSGAYQEVAQPPLYYLVAALIRAPFPDGNLPDVRWHNPGFGTQAPGTQPDNKNMLIHTELEAWPWRGAALAIHMTRLTSLGFGLLTLIGLWHLALETLGDRRAAVTATSLVAFHPQFVFMSSVINNDSAATALSTLGLWLTARAVRRGSTGWHSLAMGATAGLAALTKTSTLPLIGFMIVAVLWGELRHRRTPTKAPARRGTQQMVRTIVLLGITAILVAGWWYLRNALLYKDPLGLGSHRNTPWARAEPAPLPRLIAEMPQLIRSFWNGYGWGHVTWPESVAWILTAFSAALGLRALRRWVQGLRENLRSTTEGAKAALDRSFVMILILGWAAVLFIALLRWMQMVEAPHGRLLFPAIGAWALWLTLGLGPADAGPRAIRGGRTLLLGSLAALTALAPGARLLATYGPPRLRDPTDLPAGCEPRDLTYGDRARLLCADVTPARVSVGETVKVTGCWQAARPMTDDYTVFVHLIDDQTTRVAERHTYPGLGRFPTSLWPEGRAFCDTYRLTLEPWADAPRLYRVEIGLFDAATGDRLPGVNVEDSPIDPPVVGTVSVIPQIQKVATPGVARDATVGDLAHLTGFDAPRRAQPGETVTVTLYWRATTTHPPDAITFVHLWSPGEAEPHAQHDAPPRQGAYPTRVWVEGDKVPDRHPLTLPDDLPPGRYPLWAGLYLRSDGTRLPAVGPEGRLPHDLVPLGTIEIE